MAQSDLNSSCLLTVAIKGIKFPNIGQLYIWYKLLSGLSFLAGIFELRPAEPSYRILRTLLSHLSFIKKENLRGLRGILLCVYYCNQFAQTFFFYLCMKVECACTYISVQQCVSVCGFSFYFCFIPVFFINENP